MKIIILGAGQVGSAVAENLSSEKNDITVIDQNPQLLRELSDRFDIGTVTGHGSHPSVLAEAGAEDADMLIAVTNSDEVNMIACQVVHTLFRTPTKIARIRSSQYSRYKDLFDNKAIPIDVIISPEQLVTNYIHRLVGYPGALQVVNFAGGKVQLVAVKAFHGGPLIGRRLSELKQHMPSVDTRVAAIYRRNRAIVPTGHTIIEVDDEIFFIAAKNHIRAVMSELGRLETHYKRIIIAGGGNVGYRLALELEKRYTVKVIEHSAERAVWLSENLSRALVLQSTATDREHLLRANIENTDVFIALTNDDEANVMSSLLAKRLGARKVMTLIANPAYVDLVQGHDIDIAISPQQATIGQLLTHVRRGDIVSVHSLRRGAAEAIEAVAHGDKRSSKVVGRRIDAIDLPEGTTIGAIVRDGEVIISQGNITILSGDRVILFVVDKRHIENVEKLFQVSATFL
ncbi:MAG TPA: Trk system potassium transporter TrkA [Alcanivoracaceae bacterium]|nr:Trk system potassium transporter TrkA [Alcanivoracaceae bacterium]